MAFWGHSFSFDGIPCETFDLMVYDIGKEEQGETTFAHTVTVEEEAVGKRWRPIFYGVKHEGKLKFDLVFGVNIHRIDRQHYLDRDEIDAVATWLAGHEEYKWLDIEQDDLLHTRYRCIVTELTAVSYGRIPYAFKATVECDGPYAYMPPVEYSYQVSGVSEFVFYNESSHNGYYFPKVYIHPEGTGDIAITNVTDGDYEFKFSALPSGVSTISVDNDAMVIDADGLANPYEYFNFNFFRLKKGYNTLRFTGNFTFTIVCEFPVCPGG